MEQRTIMNARDFLINNLKNNVSYVDSTVVIRPLNSIIKLESVAYRHVPGIVKINAIRDIMNHYNAFNYLAHLHSNTPIEDDPIPSLLVPYTIDQDDKEFIAELMVKVYDSWYAKYR